MNPIIVICSQCNQGYFVESFEIKNEQQKVRCNNCSHSWTHDFRPYLSRNTNKKCILKRKKCILYFVFIFLIGSLISLGWYFREEFRISFPNSWRDVYTYLSYGLYSKNDHLFVDRIKVIQKVSKAVSSPQQVLVSGRLINISDKRLQSPQLQVSKYGVCEALSPKVRLKNFFKVHAKSGNLCLHERFIQPINKNFLEPYEKLIFSFTVTNVDLQNHTVLVHP